MSVSFRISFPWWLSYFLPTCFSFCPHLAVTNSPELLALYVFGYNSRMMACDTSKSFENSVFTSSSVENETIQLFVIKWCCEPECLSALQNIYMCWYWSCLDAIKKSCFVVMFSISVNIWVVFSVLCSLYCSLFIWDFVKSTCMCWPNSCLSLARL